MPSTLETDAPEYMHWTWDDIEPRYRDLEARTLDERSVERFLQDWSYLSERLDEIQKRLYVATTQNTADAEAARRYRAFLQDIFPPAQRAEQRLKEKLLASGLEPEGFEVPLRQIRAEAELYREENIPLLADEKLLTEDYNKIIGAQTVEWEGQEIPLQRLTPVLQETDRDRRERAWRLMHERQLADRDAVDQLWQKLLDLRRRLARNAGHPDYRSFRWQQLKRFDYTPADAARFHQAVEEIVVPAVARAQRRRQARLGVDSLRPWDLQVDPLGRPPLHPYGDISELEDKTSNVFHQVDPGLGNYFDVMRREGLLDLESRKNKAPGGYCQTFSASGRPFIFANAAGTRFDVEVLLHEGGHAFHAFEMNALPYYQQRSALPMEFAEVASMSMEFLAEPYLTLDRGGFYTEEEAARVRVDHLEQRVLALWSLIAMTDAFQHWVYEHPDEAADPRACDARWMELSRRFVPVVDWSGLETERMTGWHNILHIHVVPFYMIEYGLAELGAVQIWANSLRDQQSAVSAYRRALSLGDTRSLPDLYAVAGARFAFDADTIRSAVELIETTVAQLDPA